MKRYALVFLGSGVGTVLRAWICLATIELFDDWQVILLINIVSSYIMGIANLAKNPNIKALICAGFCGGFSTLSTFMIIVYSALHHLDFTKFFMVVLLNFALTILAAHYGEKSTIFLIGKANNGEQRNG